MFTVKKVEDKTPRTILKTFRLPVEQVKIIEGLSKSTGVNVTQIVVQMIDYCINGQ